MSNLGAFYKTHESVLKCLIEPKAGKKGKNDQKLATALNAQLELIGRGFFFHHFYVGRSDGCSGSIFDLERRMSRVIR